MLKPRALTFDMDGLMIDSEPLWRRVEKQRAKGRGKTWTDELAMSCVGKGLPNVSVTMRRELGINLEIDAGVQQLVDTFIARIEELEFHRGCVELLGAGSMPMAVATSSTREFLDSVLSRFDLAERFSAAVSNARVVDLPRTRRASYGPVPVPRLTSGIGAVQRSR